MKFRLAAALFSFLLPLFAGAQPVDQKLQKTIKESLQGFHGQVGIYVKNLRTGKTIAIQADTLFPTASMIKVSILTGVMDQLRNGNLSFHQEMIYRDSLLYPGVDILGSFKDGEKIELSKLMMLMLSMSDNTASLWLQSLAGGGRRINEILDSLGFSSTRVNSRTPGRELNRNLYGWGQTTPREMAMLFEKIYRGAIFNQAVSERMLRLLGRNYWDENGISQIPPSIFVACKNGAVDESRSETMLVMAPHNPYVWSVITKNQQDTSWAANNEGWVLQRKVSNILWNYFEPHFNWQPSTDPDGRVRGFTNH